MFGFSDEFVMYVFVPALILVLGYIFFPSTMDRQPRKSRRSR